MKKDIRKSTLPKGEIIPLKYDFVFSQIFNNPKNIEIVEGFISSYFDVPIEKVHGKIKIISRKLELENKNEASNEVDLLLDMDKQKINIEMSTSITQGIIDRNVVYASKIHSKNLKYAEKTYYNIDKTIQINLVSNNINKENLIETYYLRNKEGKILTEKFQIDYIDMEKAERICYNENTREEKLRKWCLIFMTKNEDEFNKYLKETNIMSKSAKENLNKDVKKLSEDDECIMWYSNLSKYELEHNTIIKDAKEAREEGLAEGKKEGLEQGKKEGIKEGSDKEKINIAKNSLKQNIDIEIISKITGLPKDEIEKLK